MTWQVYELLEEATNLGGQVPTEKYEGAEPRLRAHVLVFSNAAPPPQIRHRTVLALRIPARLAGEAMCDGDAVPSVPCPCPYHTRLRRQPPGETLADGWVRMV